MARIGPRFDSGGSSGGDSSDTGDDDGSDRPTYGDTVPEDEQGEAGLGGGGGGDDDSDDSGGSPGGSPGPSRTPEGTFDGGGSSGGGSSGGSSGGGSSGGGSDSSDSNGDDRQTYGDVIPEDEQGSSGVGGDPGGGDDDSGGSPGGSPGPSRTPEGTFDDDDESGGGSDSDGGSNGGGGSGGDSSDGGSPGGSPGPSRTPEGTFDGGGDNGDGGSNGGGSDSGGGSNGGGGSGGGSGGGGGGGNGGGGGGAPPDPPEPPKPETPPPSDDEQTVINPWEQSGGDVAPGQGLEAKDTPDPLGSAAIDDRGVVRTTYFEAYYEATGERFNPQEDMGSVDFRRVGDELLVFEEGQGAEGATGVAAQQFEQQVAAETGIAPENLAVNRRDGELTILPTREFAATEMAANLAEQENVPGSAVSVQNENVVFDESQLQPTEPSGTTGAFDAPRNYMPDEQQPGSDPWQPGEGSGEQFSDPSQVNAPDPTATPDDFYMPQNVGPQSGFATDPETVRSAEVDPGVLEAYRGETVEGIDSPNTVGAGFFSAEQEAQLQGLAEGYTQTVRDITGFEGSTGAGRAARGFATGVGRVFNVPAWAIAGETLVETAQKTPEVVAEEGAVDVMETFTAGGRDVAEAGGEAVAEDPVGTTSQFAGELATGFLAYGALQKGGDVVRSARIRRAADRDAVDLEDITTEEGAAGDIPTSESFRDAPTEQAVQEIEERARDLPSEFTPEGSEGGLIHTTGESLPSDLVVQEGRSELPGMFFSPEASPIGLEGVGSGGYSFSLRPRTPDIRAGDEIVVGPGNRIRGMPERASGFGYELRGPDGDVVRRNLGRGEAKAAAEGTDLEVRPQSDTPAYQYLTEEAEPGSFQVRPESSRSAELEAISPPGSQFAEEGITPVRIGRRQFPFTDIDIPGSGRTVPARRFQRVDTDTDVDVDAPVRGDGPDVEQPGEVTRTLPRSELTPRETPVFPTGAPSPTPSTQPSATDPVTGVSDPSPSVSQPTETAVSEPVSEPSATPPVSSYFGDPTTGLPTGPTDLPTSFDVSGPPSFGPSSAPPGSPTSDVPTSGPPSSPTGGPPSEGTPTSSTPAPPAEGPPTTTTRPFDLPDSDADEDDFGDLFGEVRGERLTDFIDPLSGEVLRD